LVSKKSQTELHAISKEIAAIRLEFFPEAPSKKPGKAVFVCSLAAIIALH
jgi:hypothetical protein